MVPAPPPAASRRVLSRTTTVAAALLLAVTGTVTPAYAGAPASAPAQLASPASDADAPGAPSSFSFDDYPHRDTAEPTSPEIEDGLVRLEATDTVQEGATTVTRKPKVTKRSASLWLNRTVDFWPPDAQDVNSIAVNQDVGAKRIVIDAAYSAPPTASLNSVVLVYFGQWDSKQETCNARVMGAAAAHDSSSAGVFWDMNSSSVGTATRSLSGSNLRITLTGNAAGNQNYDCVYAFLDEIVSSTESRQLKQSGAEDFEAEMERAPEFAFWSSDLTAAYPGKWQKIAITVRNEGNLVAKKVRLRLSGKNLTFKKKNLKVGKIKAGKNKTVTARVKLKGKKTRTLKARATANGGWKATTKMKVGHRPHPKKVKNLNGRSYWATFTGSGQTQNIWQVRGLHFVNKKWVYVGNRSEGASLKCSKKVKECFRYNYNRSNGTVRIGKIRGKVDSEGIQITKAPKKFSDLRKLFFRPLAKPKKNAKLKAKLQYVDGRGSCLAGYCSSWWRNLHLKKNGTFTWTRGGITTVGFPPFQTFVSTSGPDYEGKYKVLKNGRIRFTFTHPETGKRTRETHTIGIDANALGKHKPKHGLLIGAMPHT